LYSFFASSSRELGFDVVDNPFEPTYVHSTLLGHGAASRVYAVLDNDDKVIKLYFKDEADREAGVLSRLAQEGVPNVPQLVEADTDTDMGLVLSPRATDLRLGQFALRHALQAIDTLQAAHEKAGLVHRDIHPANLLLQDNGDILVNDWGFAVPANEPRPYSGAFIHASDSVLRHIAEGKTTFAVGPADDLVSLVRTTLVLNFPRAAVVIEEAKKAKCPPPEVARQLIAGWKSWLPRKWAKLQALAEQCDYDGVRQGLEKLIPLPQRMHSM
jgi:serine/threonine protein kinase